jgi:hypothetical protein
MADPTSISGRWWVHGEDKKPHAGKLSWESGRLELTVSIPLGMSDVEFPPVFSPQTQVPETIYGCDEKNRFVTLFRCRTRRGQSSGEDRYEILAMAGVQGAKLEGWQNPVARCVMLQIQNLHRWLNHDPLVREIQDGHPVWKIPEHDDLVYDVDPSVQIRIQRSTNMSSGLDGEVFTPNCRVYLVFKEPRSLDEVTVKWMTWTAHFFSLLIGTSTRCEKVVYWPVDVFEHVQPFEERIARHQLEATILGRQSNQHRDRMSDPLQPYMHAPFDVVKDRLGDMLKRWLEMSDRLEPVINLFSTAVFHQQLYLKAQFLLLVQCLEVYHAQSKHYDSKQLDPAEYKRRADLTVESVSEEIKDWVKQKIGLNYKSLAERLTEVFQRNIAEASRLFCPIEVTVDKIRYTRNHLTHYTNDPDSPRYLKQHELGTLNFKMEHFIWVLLLRELDAPEECIKRTMRTAPTAVFMSLSSAFRD